MDHPRTAVYPSPHAPSRCRRPPPIGSVLDILRLNRSPSPFGQRIFSFYFQGSHPSSSKSNEAHRSSSHVPASLTHNNYGTSLHSLLLVSVPAPQAGLRSRGPHSLLRGLTLACVSLLLSSRAIWDRGHLGFQRCSGGEAALRLLLQNIWSISLIQMPQQVSVAVPAH